MKEEESARWQRRRGVGLAVCIEPKPVSSQPTHPTRQPPLSRCSAYPRTYVGRYTPRGAHRGCCSSPCTAEPVVCRCHRRYTRARTCHKRSRSAQPGSVYYRRACSLRDRQAPPEPTIHVRSRDGIVGRTTLEVVIVAETVGKGRIGAKGERGRERGRETERGSDGGSEGSGKC